MYLEIVQINRVICFQSSKLTKKLKFFIDVLLWCVLISFIVFITFYFCILQSTFFKFTCKVIHINLLFIFLFFSTCRFFVVFFVCVPFFIWMFFLFIYFFTFIHLFFFSKLISAKNFIDKEDNYQFLEHDTPFFK